ncbi:esterase-like activity of phytase family protein [Rhizobium halophilum]|uniref:esterase-like activity of phytase family protein n=1 Tax=Rhizobium halophilum TaxID=2846852 RepID=UPI00374DB140
MFPLLVTSALFVILGAQPVAPSTPLVPVKADLIEIFEPGPPRTSFGRLEFLGGIEYSASDSRLGGVSAIRFRQSGREFIAVLDTGDWMTGAILRNSKGRLAGLSDLSIVPMLDESGSPAAKAEMDAEGLAVRPGQLIVSYERQHRVAVYPDPGFLTASPQAVNMVIPRQELRSNGGIETLAVSPAGTPLGGNIIAVAEKSIDSDGHLFAAVLDGPLKGIFKVAKDEPWAVTDGAFLPDGDLLLLERRFSFTGGVGMRIRRIVGDTIRPGALVDGEILMEAGMGAEIDNMEGLDVIEGPNGETHVIIVSDDNRSFLQRNLMLEFRLTE